MPVEIHELIIRARIQQNNTENESQPGGSTPQNAGGNTSANQGQQTDQLRPTVEEIIHDILKRNKER